MNIRHSIVIAMVYFLSSSLYASSVSLIGYAIPVSSPVKPASTITGIYSYIGFSPYSIELELDNTASSAAGKNQQNTLLIFTDNRSPYTHWRIGTNQVQPENGSKGGTYFLGVKFDQRDYYYTLNAEISSNFYVGLYTLASGEKLTVYQVSPEITNYFYSAFLPGQIAVTTKGSFQSLSQNLGNGTVQAFGEFSVSNGFGPLYLTAKSFFGSSQYGVYENGYVVYNSADKFQDGYSLAVRYALTPASSITAGYQVFNFTPDGSTSKSTISRLSIMVGINI